MMQKIPMVMPVSDKVLRNLLALSSRKACTKLVLIILEI
jgi:hypothetical protein